VNYSCTNHPRGSEARTLIPADDADLWKLPVLPKRSRPRPGVRRGFAPRDGTTRLAHLFQHAPPRVLFPVPAPDDAALAVVVTWKLSFFLWH
jgi:hypothetical protein